MKIFWQIGALCVLVFLALNPLGNSELHYICQTKALKYENDKSPYLVKSGVFAIKIESFQNIFSSFEKSRNIYISDDFGEYPFLAESGYFQDDEGVDFVSITDNHINLVLKKYDNSETNLSINRVSETILISNSGAYWKDKLIRGSCREKGNG